MTFPAPSRRVWSHAHRVAALLVLAVVAALAAPAGAMAKDAIIARDLLDAAKTNRSQSFALIVQGTGEGNRGKLAGRGARSDA